MKAEEEDLGEMTRSLEAVQNYLKELGTFLDRHDKAQLEKMKWQHLNWTYNVWLPLQKRVKRHLSTSRLARERQRATRAHAAHSENRRYFRRCSVAGCKYNPSRSSRPVNKPAVNNTPSSRTRPDPYSGRRFFNWL